MYSVHSLSKYIYINIIIIAMLMKYILTMLWSDHMSGGGWITYICMYRGLRNVIEFCYSNCDTTLITLQECMKVYINVRAVEIA